MKYRITHRTLYEYGAPVTVAHHAARLEPRGDPGQRCEMFSLSIHPEPGFRDTRLDYFGNHLCLSK
jgi:transglutaminase-like putative cysteine protease